MTHICTDYNPKLKPCLHYVKNGRPGFCSHSSHFRCIEHCVRNDPTLSYSYVSTYVRCFRLFYWSWLMGYRSTAINIVPYISGMLHNYLAFKHGNDPKQLERFEKKRQRVRQDYDTIPNDFLMLKPVIQAYHDADKDVIRGKTEQPQLTQHEGYQLKSITDLQYIDPKDNKHTIMDYKYTKNPDIYTFFNIQRQATIYFINNPKAEKIIYRCIRKPLYRKSKDEPVSAFQKRVYTVMVNHPLEWFTDKTYHRNEFDLDYLHEELEIISDDIKMRLSHPIETWIQNDSGCFAYGSWCDFLPLCDSRVTPEGLPHLYKRYNSEDKIMLAK